MEGVSFHSSRDNKAGSRILQGVHTYHQRLAPPSICNDNSTPGSRREVTAPCVEVTGKMPQAVLDRIQEQAGSKSPTGTGTNVTGSPSRNQLGTPPKFNGKQRCGMQVNVHTGKF